MRNLLLPFLGLLLLGRYAIAEPTLNAGDGSGLQVGGNADIVGQVSLTGAGTARDKLEAREVELVLYAPTDYLFDGQISLAAHQEANGAFFEIHEAFLSSPRLIPRSRIRLGQFFLQVGRLNQHHRHDWPFTTAPRVQRDFFNSAESAIDSGVEYSWLAPLPFYLDLTLGLTSGYVFGHAHGQGVKPGLPTHYLRGVTYFDLPWNGGVQTGLNYLGRRDSAGTDTNLFGVDVTAKWREGAYVAWLFQSETWFRVTSPRNAATENALGFYAFVEHGLHQQLFAGLRLDGFTVTNLKDALRRPTSNFELALVPQLTYRPSEFSTLRLSYTHLNGRSGGVEVKSQRMLELQAMFILGAHPAHDF